MSAPDVVLAAPVRTPMGRFQGTLSPMTAPQLGATVVRETIRRAGVDPEAVEEVILGHVLQAGCGQNPARQAALHGGVPATVPAMTINKVCGSGLKAVALAAQAIRAGDLKVAVAGGMESMSNAPYALRRARGGYRMGHGEVTDLMIADGLWDAYEDYHMGNTGELVAAEHDVTRERQDEFALESHRRAVAAMDDGRFKDEITAVEVPQRKGDPVRFDTDETPRRDSSMEALSGLRPAFQKDGTVTAGNAPGVNDGASAMVVAEADRAKELGIEPVARVLGYAVGGVEPKWVMMAPVDAVRRLYDRHGFSNDDFDLFEVNEAFSAAACAVCGELDFPMDKVNVNGGAVALGHPIGASGARILTTLVHALRDRDKERGLATLCLGGGNAVALAVERI